MWEWLTGSSEESDVEGFGPVADDDTYGAYLDDAEDGSISGGYDSILDYGDAYADSPDSQSNSNSGWGSFFTDVGKGALKGLIAQGGTIYGAYNQKQIQDEALRQKKESDKYAALMELAKLRYGQKGGVGGGGGGASRSQLAMEYAKTLLASSQAKSQSYQALQQAFSNIYKS
jgi:hypothetical protein